jgi:mannose-6-phosphate isomerase-like protein (cupin superfamily)
LKSEKVIKAWGWEEVILNHRILSLCSKILHYNNGGSVSSFHYHPEKSEVFRCIAGSFIFRYKDSDGTTLATTMVVGDSVFIPKSVPHQLQSLEANSEILEISTFHDDLDVVRIEPGDSQR